MNNLKMIFRKGIGMMLMGILVLSMVSAAGQTEPAVKTKGEVPSVTMLVLDYGRDKISEDLFVFKMIEEKIGVKVIPVPVLEQSFSDKLDTMIAGGNLPDIITIPYATAQKYGPLGVFKNYKADLESSLPNLAALLSEYTEVETVLPAEDGGYYSLPQISTQLDYDYVFGVREDLLKLQGKTKEDIRTLEDLHAYLRESKGQLNGLIEYPWTLVSAGEELLTVIPTHFGVGGTAKLFYTDDGFTYGPTTEKFRIYIQFLRDLYAEKLIHPDVFSLSRSENREMFWKGKSAFYTYPEYLINGSFNDDLARLSGNSSYRFSTVWPVEFGGSTYIPRRAHALYSDGRWSKAINAKAKNLDAVYKVIDFLYGEEGSALFYFGEKNVHYTTTPTKEHVWLLNFGWNSEMVGSNASSYVEYGLANLRYIFLRPYFPQKPSLNQVYYNTLANIDKLEDPAPIVNLSLAENDEYASIMVTISTYALENCARFVTGRRPMSEWNQFVQELQRMNLQKAIDIYNTAISR